MRRHAKALSAGSTSGTGKSRAPFGRTFACLLVLAAFAGSGASAASAAVTPKGVTGFFAATGTAGGQLNTPRGSAVNQANGNVYTADSSNNRISVFNSSGTFLRAFGQDVVESGPDNNGTGYEICVAANGDVCKVGITTASTGGAMNAPQGIAIDQSTNNVYVTDGNNQRVQKFDANGNFLLAFGQDVVASGPGNSPATSAVQTLTVTADGGKYKLKFGGKETAELAFDSSASAIQTALTGLTSIGAGNATVSETGTRVYSIAFAGALANNPEPLVATESGPGEPLTNGIAGVVNTTTGASGFEVCVAANGDVCKTGISASTGGAFKSTFNGYPAVAPAGSPNAGDVLVADPANLRVQEFNSSGGAFLRTFGFDVVAAGPGNSGVAFEVCAAANGDACKIGVTGSGSGQFAVSVNRVAEDAAGNLYTVESGTPNFRVQKFTLPGNVVTPQGNFSEANLKGAAAASAPLDVAIDPSNSDVLVTKAFAAGSTPSCANTGVASVAEKRIVEVSSAGALEATHMGCAGINLVNGIAARGSTGDVYVASTTGESRLYVLNSNVAPPSASFSGVADIGAHGATVSGFVNPNGPALAYGLTTGYHVNYKRSVDSTFSKAPAADVNLGKGTSNLLIAPKLIGLEAGTSYDVQILATRPFNGGTAVTSTFTFSTPVDGPEITTPTVTSAASPIDASAMFSALVTPNSQATTYRFEYGTSQSYGSSAPVSLASAGSGANAVPVSQSVTGLLPSTTYHFRLVANNGSGEVKSADQIFTTPSTSSALPDNRAYELVSPADKRPVGYVGALVSANERVQASSDGNGFYYIINNGLADSTAGGEISYIANRNDSGWESTQVTPPALVPSIGVGSNVGNVLYASPKDLSCTLTSTAQPLTDDTSPITVESGGKNYYRRNADGSYTLISNQVPSNVGATNTAGFTDYPLAGVSEDCTHIFFSTEYRLLPSAPASGSGLYEWANGTLRYAGIRPDGSIAPDAKAGGGPQLVGVSLLNVISRDGSRLFFSATSNSGKDSGNTAVFVRKNGTETVDASQSQTTVGGDRASFQMASVDGSHVFFLGQYGLASTSSTGAANCAAGGGAGCDLYGYNVDTGKLTDLSVDTNPVDAGGAGVKGVLGASDDGAYVYFAARGQLIPGQGNTESQNNSGAKFFNIYLSHDGQLSFAGLLTESDTGNGVDSAVVYQPNSWSSRVTPDGKHLLFASRASVTGYPNGASTQAYLYSTEKDTTTCVSCPPSGVVSVAETEPLPTQQIGGVSEYPRTLSEDGSRVFFESKDALAPGAVSGQGNIYEWENGRIHLLLGGAVSEGFAVGAQFEDASSNGDDVFITTKAHLAGQDFDRETDVYDVRVDGGFPFTPPPLPCAVAASECQGPESPQPSAVSSPGEGFSGPGNPPLKEAKKQKQKKHKKKHQKKHKKKAHKRHHARATNNNGRAAR